MNPTTALEFARPNKLCFREDNSAWKPIPVAHASILIPFNAHSHVSYISPHKPSSDALTLREYAPSRAGFQFLPAAGEWWINLPLAGSTAADVCYIVYDCGSEEAGRVLWDQITASVAANAIDLVRFGGVAVGGGLPLNSTTAQDERLIAALVRAGLTGVDSGQAAGAMNRAIEARTPAAFAGGVTSLYSLLVSAVSFGFDTIAGALGLNQCVRELVTASSTHQVMVEGRKAGFHSSLRGRRFTVKSPNATGVASVVGAFVATTPTYLIVNGATNEMIVRRIKSTCSNLNAATKRQMLIKTDTADRFSAGGTTRTPVTMNNGNVVAASQARSLEAPTATAEGGGTRDVDVIGGKLAAGEPMTYEPEDGLVVAAGGSLLVYNLSGGAATTEDVVIEYEDGNVQ